MNEKYMREAIKTARIGQDKVYPNPPVGCVIVKGGKIVGRGRHEYFGGNHAEINALAEAGSQARGADLYVTLEPCNNHGKRPPCTQSIIKQGIKRVFFAVKDPNMPNSKKTLQNTGIEVQSGILEKQAKGLIKEYLKHLKTKNRVTVKAAMTLDGKIATYKGDSKWISSEKSRNFVHKLRTGYDAVLVGTDTALKDNPFLTARSKGKNPVRVVIDADLKIPKKHHIYDASAPTVIVFDEKHDKSEALRRSGVIPATVNIAKAKKDFGIIIKKLNSLSLKTILIEGGGSVISSALFSNCVDDIYLFIAPKIAGGKDAVPVVGGKGVAMMSDVLKVTDMKVKKSGGDLLITAKLKKRG